MIDPGTEASDLISESKTKFILLVNQFNAYDFQVVKQQLFKFY